MENPIYTKKEKKKFNEENERNNSGARMTYRYRKGREQQKLVE
jgi:hypothetical protein